MRDARDELVAFALGLFCLVSVPAFAEEAAPVAAKSRTIAEVLANPIRDEVVTVRGNVTWRVKGNDYLLDDGTGKLIVDGGPIEHHSLDLPVDSTVVVTGEVSLGPSGRKEPRAPEISAYSVTKADGTVVQLRTSA